MGPYRLVGHNTDQEIRIDQDRSGQIDRSGMRDYDIKGAFKSRIAVTMSEAPSSRRLLAVPFVAKARGDRWCEYKDV